MSNPASVFHRILVPVDGSPPSDSAVALAIGLAKGHAGSIAFCHAIDLAKMVAEATTPYGVTYLGPMIDALNAEADEILSEATARAAAAGVQSSTLKPEGAPVGEILRYAAAQRIDAIVMGTQGKRGLKRFFLGSTAEGALRGATVPVFVVHGEVPTRSPVFRRILVAVDDSEQSDAAADRAVALAAGEGSELVFCSVVPIPHFLKDLERYGVDTDSILEDWRGDAARLLRHADAHAKAAGVKSADGLIVTGDPIEEILRAGREQKADLIVMGTHGRRGLRRMFLGSVAEGVVRDSTIPVLIVRSPLAKVSIPATFSVSSHDADLHGASLLHGT